MLTYCGDAFGEKRGLEADEWTKQRGMHRRLGCKYAVEGAIVC